MSTKNGSSQEWRDTGIVQGQQTKLEVAVVGEAQASRFITLILVKVSLEKADNPLSL